MSSFMAKASDCERKWYIIDATDKPLGRVAVAAANILRGKHLPTFTPNVDCGEHVIVINSDKAILTGKKLENKVRYHHTGWIGGLKETHYSDLMRDHSDRAMYLAIEGMLPHNTLGAKAMKRLRVYKGAEHDNAAQKPEMWTGEIK